MLRITELKVPLTASMEDIKKLAGKRLGVEICDINIVRRGIDARKKNDVHYVFTVDVVVENEEKLLRKSIKNVSAAPVYAYSFPEAVNKSQRPIVVGMGPAGLFAGLYLARAGCRPIIFERGADVDSRSKKIEEYWSGGELSEQTNVQFGEGGAGTFSDGKLNTGTKDIRIREVLKEFVKHGAPKEILTDAKPHIGTDILRNVVKNIRKEIERHGGEVYFNRKLCDIGVKNNRVYSVFSECDGYITETPTDCVLLAIGHSARDTVEMLYSKGIIMQKKPFSVGARIEHSQEFISRAMYGDAKKFLPAADYKMAVHLPDGRSLYTFCMCPGGYVVAAASEKEALVTNGMSYSKRDGENANSAILVSVTPEDFPGESPLAGFEFQREIEKKAYNITKSSKAPCQTVGSFLFGKDNIITNVKPTYRPGVVMSELSCVLPEFVINTMKSGILEMDKKIHGFACEDAILTAPETRSSSPVRFVRNENMELSVKGVMSAGEGGGYAGGIMSSAVEGIKAAEIIAKL